MEACFGKCFLGPNILVERWRGGRRNETAMFALMLGQQHSDLQFEHQVEPSQIGVLVESHLSAWRASRPDREV
jgi:hypothetical protein